MRALIVDDHVVMRTGLRALLEKNEDVTVIGEAGTAREAVDLAAATRPDVIFMDIELPGGSGIGATEEIIRNRWCEKIVMVSAYDTPSFVESALRAGARGYVLKAGASDEIFTALDEVCRGGSYVTPMLSGRDSATSAGASTREESLVARLSPREKQVLVRIAEGLGSKEIAVELGVSHRTVETHRTNLMRKVGVRKASELVRIAIREGLIVA
jgi:two-component system response regulator NreC